MNSDCLLAFPIPCFSKKMHTDGERIRNQIGDPEIVNYFQVIESCSSCLDKFERGCVAPIHLFSKKVRRIIICRTLFAVILTKPFYHCHSTGVVGNKRRSQAWQTTRWFIQKEKEKDYFPSFRDSSIESMRGITRCNYTPAKGFNACSIRRNARVQLQPYSPDARPNINSARNK